MAPPEDRTGGDPEARAQAAELELERAHRLLDAHGVPRELRRPGEREALEYSLEARLRLVLEDEEQAG